MNRGLIEAVDPLYVDSGTGALPRFMNRGLIEATNRPNVYLSQSHFPDS